jgi:alpha-glucosidase
VPVPWEREGPSLGFGSGAPWLPQPAGWAARSVQAQQGGDGSTLELYRSALRLRRELLGGGDLEWLDSPAGSLVFRRRGRVGEVLCAVNLDAQAIDLPAYDRVLLSSVPLDGDHPERLPGDAAVWLR